METSPNETLLTSPDNPNGVVLERSLPTPHFDESAIQSARPAVPLARIQARRFWPLALVLMCAASLVGAVMGVALSRYEKRSAQISTPAVTEESTVSTGSSSEGIVTSAQEASTPLHASVSDPENKSNGAGPATAERNAEATRSVHPPETSAVGDEPLSDKQSSDAHATLNGALEEWIAATNARDIQRQMDFYNPTVNAFYRTRNVPREAVRAEKSRVFGRAGLIDIKAAAPGIRLSRDGRTATMRFRKKYAIEGGGEDRRGEVVQELRWRRTNDGWKIVSERDLQVIN